jgi:hypothetical protein
MLPVSYGTPDVPEEGQHRLRIVVHELRPSEPRLQYLTDQGWLRRLCVNTEHRPISSTHKHRAVGGGDDSCYVPQDIPPIPLAPRVPEGALRAILEAFAAECGINLGPGYLWTPPWKGV